MSQTNYISALYCDPDRLYLCVYGGMNLLVMKTLPASSVYNWSDRIRFEIVVSPSRRSYEGNFLYLFSNDIVFNLTEIEALALASQ